MLKVSAEGEDNRMEDNEPRLTPPTADRPHTGAPIENCITLLPSGLVGGAMADFRLGKTAQECRCRNECKEAGFLE